MVDAKIVELINREIDSELGVGEKSRLDAYLKNDVEAKTLYDELKNLADNLNGQEQIEPFEDLKSTIMSEIKPELYQHGTREKPTIFKSAIFLDRRRIRMVLAYAAVFIVGFCLSALLLNPAVTSNSMNLYKILGTIGIQEIPEINHVEFISINIDELNGEVTLKQAGSYVWVEFNIDSGPAYTSRITYDSQNLSFLLFRPLDPEVLLMKSSGDQLNISTSRPFVLSFMRNSDQASQLEFSIQANHKTTKDYKFSISNILSPRSSD